jgi:hypothetical protein
MIQHRLSGAFCVMLAQRVDNGVMFLAGFVNGLWQAVGTRTALFG